MIKSYDLSRPPQGPRKGLGGFLAIWYWTADRLVRCARLLRVQGQDQGQLPRFRMPDGTADLPEGARVMSEAKEVLGAIKALNIACPMS